MTLKGVQEMAPSMEILGNECSRKKIAMIREAMRTLLTWRGCFVSHRLVIFIRATVLHQPEHVTETARRYRPN